MNEPTTSAERAAAAARAVEDKRKSDRRATPDPVETARKAELIADAEDSRVDVETHLTAIREQLAETADEREAVPANTEAVISLDGVSLSFGARQILKNVTLEARKGETLMVAGESGSGKSTILKLILRLLVPDKGRIFVFDNEVELLSFQEALEMRREIGMVFQNAALFDSLNVYENVAYPLRENTDMDEAEIERTVAEKLDFVDLDPKVVMRQLPSQLSGGMRKRVGIARAIATSPKIILYDEPTAGLDPLTVGTINDLVRKLQRELNVTSLVVTHDIRAGFRVASRVNLLREGEIVFDGTPEDMVASDDKYIKAFLS
jgi:phospholipid/cholesterol/gamma-HCH transport system ATP-binding protein